MPLHEIWGMIMISVSSLLSLETIPAISQQRVSMVKDVGCLQQVKMVNSRFGIPGKMIALNIKPSLLTMSCLCRSGNNPVLTRNFSNGAPINDAVMHANQGELVTCDQNGSVKIWDLAAHACTHELVRL